MALTTRVEVEDDRPVVVKRAPAAEAARLQREAERLRRARHPGVVPIVRSAPDGEGWVLCLGHSGRPVAALGALTVPQVASLTAGLATTLADLHHLGIVHGRIDGTHVLVGEHGRPVLCGFGDGEPAAGPEDDVAALGALLVELLGTDEAGEPIPERRWRGRRGWSGWDRRALLLLADQAAAEPPTRRPTARRLAAAIADAVPGRVPAAGLLEAASETVEASIEDPIERRRATAVVDPPSAAVPRWAVAIALAGLLLVGLGAGRFVGGEAPREPAAAVGPATRIAAPVADSTLEVDGRRYRVGQEGDALLVGDWDCDGEPTPAVLRPTTGEVFVFPRWVTDGVLAVEPMVQVPGARALLSERPDGACPTLSVRTETGTMVPVTAAVR
jgi:tRNA A-37 threonylcarbamoyl transferase component Bud32